MLGSDHWTAGEATADSIFGNVAVGSVAVGDVAAGDDTVGKAGAVAP